MTKGYEFDFVTGVLTVTATFMKKASTNIRSEEYSILKQYKKDFPELKVEIAKANSNNGEKRLTYPQMKSFIKMNYTAKKDGVKLTEEQIAENKRIDALVAEFDRMKQLSKIHKNPYNFVFSWFKKQFVLSDSSKIFTDLHLFYWSKHPMKDLILNYLSILLFSLLLHNCCLYL